MTVEQITVNGLDFFNGIDADQIIEGMATDRTASLDRIGASASLIEAYEALIDAKHFLKTLDKHLAGTDSGVSLMRTANVMAAAQPTVEHIATLAEQVKYLVTSINTRAASRAVRLEEGN